MKLDHLFAITDHNAVLQHAKFSVPARREGYTVDDNARALVFAVKAKAYWPSQPLSELQRKLISFLLLMPEIKGLEACEMRDLTKGWKPSILVG